MVKTKVQEFASVWDAIADTPEEAANLRLRAELMTKIREIVTRSGGKQVEAAERRGVTQPRISDLIVGGFTILAGRSGQYRHGDW